MEEVVKGGESCISLKKCGRRCKGWVARRNGDRITSCEREQETWGKGTFKMHVMFCFRKGGEERVKMSFAHCVRSGLPGKNRV